MGSDGEVTTTQSDTVKQMEPTGNAKSVEKRRHGCCLGHRPSAIGILANLHQAKVAAEGQKRLASRAIVAGSAIHWLLCRT